MEAHPIQSGFKGDRFGRRAVALVDSIGRSEFSAELFRLAHEAMSCRHVTAFALEGGRPPRVVLAENTGETRVAFSLAQKYVTRYWRLDPADRVFSQGGAKHEFWSVRSSASDITDSIYRDHCYGSVGLDHRLSIAHQHREQIYRLNFYCARGRAFDDDAASGILGSAELLMALIRRHDAESKLLPDLASETFAERLGALAPGLRGRELEVTALIASGFSSRDIALEIGISINTVLTYRKRAYARLGISTQNDLMQLLLGTRNSS